MKITTLILFFLLVSMTTAIAQDYIVLKTGTEVKCKIVKLSPKEVEYKPFDNLDGPTIAIDRKTVFMFRYPGRTEPNNPADKGSGGNDQQETVEKSFIGAIYGGVVLPLGSYSENDIDKIPNAGGANTGFGIGLQVGYRINKSISFLADANYTSNAYSIKFADRRYVYTLAGNWTHFSIMPSVKLSLPVTDQVNFYLMGSVGSAFTKVTGDIGNGFADSQATSLSYGITFGSIILKHMNINVMYRTSTPTFKSTYSFVSDYKLNTSVIGLSVGYEF
jgi:hypothetical protein